ncbi:hypothetical protein niasHT_014483 [Heterodera trifolii]|uniref:Secreted protein n=1 Tax=Heterodera trifolii TaxID=157864 RepID=A0ABD2KZT1_9BILA
MNTMPPYCIIFFGALLLAVQFCETTKAEEPKMANAIDGTESKTTDDNDDQLGVAHLAEDADRSWKLDEPNREHLRDYW